MENIKDSPLKENKICENINKSNFITVDQDKNGVWWFVGPNGKEFYSICTGCSQPPFSYENISTWKNKTEQRLKKWGFNSLAGDLFPNWPFFARIKTKHLTGTHGWKHTRHPDVFDQDWKENVTIMIKELANKVRNNTYLLGYEIDNEMKWGPDLIFEGIGDDMTLLDLYISAPKETPGKKEVFSFLRNKYSDNISNFNLVWNMNLSKFSDLLDIHELGIKKSWRITSKIDKYVSQIISEYKKYRENPMLFEKAKEDVVNFSKYVAETYFSFINKTLKKADSNHLYMGMRIHNLGIPREILEIHGKYTDVITINNHRYYKFENFEKTKEIGNYYFAKKYGCVSYENFMENYYKITKKPIFVSEGGAPCFWINGSLPLIRNFAIELVYRPAKCSITKKGALEDFKWYVNNCLNCPYVIGHHRMMYYDLLKWWGTGGLVNLWDEPNKFLVEEMTSIYNNASKIHEKSYLHSSKNKILNKNFKITEKIIDKFLKSSDFKVDKKSFGTLFEKNNHILEPLTYKNNFEKTFSNITKSSHIIYVDNDSLPPGNGTKSWPYCKIQYAIDNSIDGDTIYVLSGTYKELITINKTISLIGENSSNTIIGGYFNSENDVIITIDADNINIINFSIATVEGTWIDSTRNVRSCTGITVKEQENCTISNNIFYNLSTWEGANGIEILNCNNITIKNNIFSNIKRFGITSDHTNNLTIYNNVFYEIELYGIWISCCKKNKIISNKISNTKIGIILVKANNNLIKRNDVFNNSQKIISLKNSNSNDILENNFINNPPSSLFYHSSNNNWNKNYWDRSRISPKIISGRTGSNSLKPTFDFDFNPSSKYYR